MAKRKSLSETKTKKRFEGEESSGDEEDENSLVDVDFEFFDPQPAVDFHGLKTLIRQLLDTDAELVDLSALSDLILAQPLLGSTIKVDGNESDPFAFLTVLNLREHAQNPAINTITKYLAQQATKNPSLAPLTKLLDPSGDVTVGLILGERMQGMPTQLVPPMYRMLVDEIRMALEEKEPYTFTHYLILSKTYVEIESQLDQEDDRPKKKKKGGAAPETMYYHEEDECLHEHAIAFGDCNLVKEGAEGDADARRAFSEAGIKPSGHMILIEAGKFEDAVKGLEQYVLGNAMNVG